MKEEKNLFRRLKRYKESKFESWSELVMTFGTDKLEDGGIVIFLFTWGGMLGLVVLYFLLKLTH